MALDLSPQQIDEFYDRGFLVLEDVFTGGEVGEISRAIDGLVQKSLSPEVLHRARQSQEGKVMYEGSEFVITEQDGESQIRRVVWCGASEPILLRYGQTDPRLRSIAGQIMGADELNHLVNQVHFKLPNDGVMYPWHQDSLHRGYGTDSWTDVNGLGSYVQTVTAIDEITEDNGPILFIPESGSEGHLSLPYSDHEELNADRFKESDAVPVLAKPGSVIVFGPYVIHGSKPNTSDSSRRVFINGFSYPGANHRVYPGEGAGTLIDLV